MKTLITFLFLSFYFTLSAQNELNYHVTEIITKKHDINLTPAYIKNNKRVITWSKIRTIEHVYPRIKELKKAKTLRKYPKLRQVNNRTPIVPSVNNQFDANATLQLSPPDNSLAISNAGFIVSANNDGIMYLQEDGTVLFSSDWGSFFNDTTLTYLYDPHVIYDPVSDRFIFVLVNDFVPANSKVVLGFSKSNNPNIDGWWIYKISGNPFNNSCYSDYPQLGISGHDAFITLNLYDINDYFVEAYILQIDKQIAYSGSVNMRIWHNLSNNPYYAFALTPVSDGQGNSFGPGLFFVSSNPYGANTIRVYRITNDVQLNPSITFSTINLGYAYSPAGYSLQQGTNNQLDTGDCRTLSAFMLNQKIFFTLQTDIGNAWNGILFGKIDTTNNMSTTYTTFGTQNIDYAYPSLAWFGNSNSNNEDVLFTYMSNSTTTFPSIAVVSCDTSYNWGTPVIIKQGDQYIDYDVNSIYERWGDYSGISRKYITNQTSIWVSGSYARSIFSHPITHHRFGTYIAELIDPASSVGDINLNQLKVYPNPAGDYCIVYFKKMMGRKTIISLYDMNSKLVYKTNADLDTNTYRIRINTSTLKNGIYRLLIHATDNTIVADKKIVVTH